MSGDVTEPGKLCSTRKLDPADAGRRMLLVLEGTEEDFAQHGLEETHNRMGDE